MSWHCALSSSNHLSPLLLQWPKGIREDQVTATAQIMSKLGGSDGKEPACNAGDLGSIPRSGRSPGEGNGKPFQYSCLENSMNQGAWWATVHSCRELDMTE